MSNVLNTIGRTIERFGKAMRVFSEAGDKQLNRAQSPTPPSWSSQPDSWHAQSTLSTRHAGATTWVPQSPLNERPVALRKGSLNELAACCMGSNRDRFERELKRLLP
jgi:hypothetical protein